MTKLKIVFGLCVLSALAICAFAAQGASALTAWRCVPAVGLEVQFSDAHCTKPVTPTPNSVGFRAVEIGKTPLSIPWTITNVTTGTTRSTAKLKSAQSGVTLELQATEVSGTGEMGNQTEGATMWAMGNGKITFKGVTVTAPAGKGCVVKGGEVVTNELEGTSKGLTNQLKFSPVSGSFAEFTVEGCSVTALNHKYSATGSVTGNTEGATIKFTHLETTAQNTLFLFEQKAGFEGETTLKDSEGNGLFLK